MVVAGLREERDFRIFSSSSVSLVRSGGVTRGVDAGTGGQLTYLFYYFILS